MPRVTPETTTEMHPRGGGGTCAQEGAVIFQPVWALQALLHCKLHLYEAGRRKARFAHVGGHIQVMVTGPANPLCIALAFHMTVVPIFNLQCKQLV